MADIVFKRSLPTQMQVHVEAFEQLCGIVETEVVPGDLKAAMLAPRSLRTGQWTSTR
jgi:hypothetical protein